MIYNTPYDRRYYFRKNYPIFGMLSVIAFMFWMIYGSSLMAGETMFKDCNNCGWLNYQFSNTCSCCGASNNFTDVYLKPDVDKRDAKKKKAKCIKITDNVEAMNDLYDIHITPIEILIYQMSHQHRQSYEELMPILLSIREYLIEKHDLQQYRRPIYSE